jgi:hypothetical protein
VEDALSMVFDDEPVSLLPPLAVRATVDPASADATLPDATLSVIMHQFPVLLEMISGSHSVAFAKRMESVVRRCDIVSGLCSVVLM